MKVKFFITPVYPFGDDHYFHEIIGLAEGFAALGHEFFANADYWWMPETESYLLKGSKSKAYDIAIYDYRYARSFEHLLFREGFPNFPKDKVHVLVDRNDGISPIWNNNPKYFDVFTLILSGNLFSNKNYPSKLKPWSIGLCQRQIDAMATGEKSAVTPRIGHNFRVAHNMRGAILEGLKNAILKYPLELCLTDNTNQETIDNGPIDQHYYAATTNRHNPAYFKLLNESLLFLAFGGYFGFGQNAYEPLGFAEKVFRKKHFIKYNALKKQQKDFSNEIYLYQSDSFRAWETLASDTCPVLLDFESWNILLPETPKNGTHYLGIRKMDINSFAKQLETLSIEEIQQIGQAGKKWSLKHYSPTAQANRLMQYLDERKK